MNYEKKYNQALEKQGEQPTNKIEPKFKVGDWITDGYIHCNITEILDDRYIFESKYDKRGAILFEHENRYHLWTINDAKDGDVLAAHECFVLFKKLDGLNIKCYCTYHYMNNPSFHVDTLHNKDAFHPSTKEQRDTLMKAMANAGYEWDAEKKELKKIEVASKEGKDERKELILYLKGIRFTTVEGAEQVRNWITWLEKQET